METTLPCYRKRPINRLITQESYPYLILGVLAGLLLGFFFGALGALLPVLFTFYVLIFFRNPSRKAARQDRGLVISPADGTILEIVDDEEKHYLKSKAKRVSIFMSPFNCHINRAPITAKVVDCFYKEGTFAAAFKPKAMETNEHHAVLLEEEGRQRWLVVQIAGFLARRIVSYVQGGMLLNQGDRFGLIQFGSRTDLYCPTNVEIFVKPGQKVYGGRTILGTKVAK